MSAEFQSDHDRLVAELRATIAEQQAELDELRSGSAGMVSSRRALLRGAGVVGGIAALATAGSASRPRPAAAVEGHNVKYAPNSLTVYAKVVGQKQGAIQGGVIQKGFEGSLDVTYFQQKGNAPRDAASGLATGRRQYNPVVFRKRVDKASPRLESAFVGNEVLTSVQFTFLALSGDGTTSALYKVDLTNAAIASIDLYSPEGIAGTPGGESPGLLEELSLVFQTITWTYPNGGITAQDDTQPQT